MSESLWEPQVAVETQEAPVTARENSAEPQPEPSRTEAAEPAALAVSVDDFTALEQRIYRAVELVKRERDARVAAEARMAEWESRAASSEVQLQGQSLVLEQVETELHALRAEREQVRQRVDRLLKQLDSLEL